MRVFVKICGLKTPEAVRAAVDAGADAVGFVFADSPRRVTAETAATLATLVPAGILRVAVMRHPLPAYWNEVAAVVRPDWLQTDAEDFAGLALPPGVAALPVYRDLPGLDVTAAVSNERILFEAATSGAGCRPDWQRAHELARRTSLMLAGGLDAGNVGEAIRCVRPWGVDVSSGVEAQRGVKDSGKIAAFVAAVRRAEQECDDDR